jgi:hypothetical protein
MRRATSESDLYRWTTIKNFIVQHGDAVTNASPLANQDGPRTGSRFREALEGVLFRSVRNLIEQSLCGLFQTAEGPLLKPVCNGSDHQEPSEIWKRVSFEGRCLSLSQSGVIQFQEILNFLS